MLYQACNYAKQVPKYMYLSVRWFSFGSESNALSQ